MTDNKRQTDNLEDFPRIVKKPGGHRLKVQNSDELQRAQADGWQLHLDPKDEVLPTKDVTTTATTTSAPNPEMPPPPALSTLPPAVVKGDPKSDSKKVASDQDVDTILGQSATDVKDAIAKELDLRTLQNYRLRETKGKNRQVVLDALDVRIAELAKK